MKLKPSSKNNKNKIENYSRRIIDNRPLARLQKFFFGHPLKTSYLIKEQVGFWLGLPLLGVDIISSLAYATEEVLLALSLGGTQLFKLSLPISLSIILLLWTLVISYSQTVQAYPEGGGAYIVTKNNLNPFSSVLAASTLILDYILTVAVSTTAGIRALTSAYPPLLPFATELSVGGVLILGWLNLRGTRESAYIIFIPVYLFIFFVFIIGISGLGGLRGEEQLQNIQVEEDIIYSLFTIFIILRAFAGGCTAMTGIEAVANAGKILKEPTNRTAQYILIALGLIGTVSFFLITYVANQFGLIPLKAESLLSQICRHSFGNGFFYMFFQILTAGILFLAANTSFAGFPQLAAMVAKDKWLPKQLCALGDRLVFSHGIIWLCAISSVLVLIFKGSTHALIPLYAIGVFSAFTLNQLGMTRFWYKFHKKNLKKSSLNFNNLFSFSHVKMVINAIGAFFTALALIIISVTKFMEGGFLIFIGIPLMISCFYIIRNHYLLIEKELIVTQKIKKQDIRNRFSHLTYKTVVVPVSRLHYGAYKALAFSREISKNTIALIVNIDKEVAENTKKQIEELNWGIKIVMLDSPYRSIITPIVNYVLYLDKSEKQLVTIVLPEIVPAKWWHKFLHNSTAVAIAKVLSWSKYLQSQARIIVFVPFLVKK